MGNFGLFQAAVAGAFADAFFLEGAFGDEFAEGAFHGADGESRAEGADVLLGEAADFLHGGLADGFQCGLLGFDEGEAVVEIFVGGKDGPQEVADEGCRVVLLFVPADLTFAEGAVVEIFVFGDFGFEGNIFSNLETVLVEEEGGEEAAHASVSVIEGMNAQKIVNENGDEEERLGLAFSDGAVVFVAKFGERYRRLIRGERREKGLGRAVRMGRADVILHIFQFAAHGIGHVAAQDFVELQDVIDGNGDDVEIFVNEGEDVAIAGDFFFVTIFRRRFFQRNLPEPRRGGEDAFDGV